MATADSPTETRAERTAAAEVGLIGSAGAIYRLMQPLYGDVRNAHPVANGCTAAKVEENAPSTEALLTLSQSSLVLVPQAPNSCPTT